MIKDYKQRTSFKNSEIVRVYSKAFFFNSNIPSVSRWLYHFKFNEMSLLKNLRVNYKNYCLITGRSKAIYKKFKMSRIMLRTRASLGLIPGVRKSTW